MSHPATCTQGFFVRVFVRFVCVLCETRWWVTPWSRSMYGTTMSGVTLCAVSSPPVSLAGSPPFRLLFRAPFCSLRAKRNLTALSSLYLLHLSKDAFACVSKPSTLKPSRTRLPVSLTSPPAVSSPCFLAVADLTHKMAKDYLGA